MKNPIMIMALLGMSIVFAGLPSAFAQATHDSFTTGWEPFESEALNNCNGEYVSYMGMSRLTMKFTQDGAGGSHLLFTGGDRGVGVGLTTGSEYLGSSTGAWTDNTTAGGAYETTSQLHGRLISLDRDVPDLHYVLGFHITIDPNGNVRSEINKFEILCR